MAIDFVGSEIREDLVELWDLVHTGERVRPRSETEALRRSALGAGEDPPCKHGDSEVFKKVRTPFAGHGLERPVWSVSELGVSVSSVFAILPLEEIADRDMLSRQSYIVRVVACR